MVFRIGFLIRLILDSDNQLMLVRFKIGVVKREKAENGNAVPEKRAPSVNHFLCEGSIIDFEKSYISANASHVPNHEDHVVCCQGPSPLRLVIDGAHL